MALKQKTDNKVKSLYKLENTELPKGSFFSTLQNVQSYVDFVTSTREWQDMGNVPSRVTVIDWGENPHSEATWPNEIWLSRSHWNQQVILHELAHFVSPKASHGKVFVKSYLMLITYFMGRYFTEVYGKAFRREGIKF